VVFGRVIDYDTKQPVAGASVQLRVIPRQLGAVTDNRGAFRFENVPALGRETVAVDTTTHIVDRRALPALRPGQREVDLGTIVLVLRDPANSGRGRVGVRWQTRPDGSVVIAEVAPETPSAAAGIRPGDLLLAVNGKEVGGHNVFAAMGEARADPDKDSKFTVQTPGEPARVVTLPHDPHQE
jgi:predicted metalloprotease with PDZ domain